MPFSLVHRFRRRSPVERRVLALALGAVVVVRLALTVAPSRLIIRAVRRLTERDRRPRHDASRRLSSATIVWAVEAVARYIPGATCLTQALAAQFLLQRYDVAATLCIGVARSHAGDFRAHAWLEREGRIILGGEQSRDFARFPSIARAASGLGALRAPRPTALSTPTANGVTVSSIGDA